MFAEGSLLQFRNPDPLNRWQKILRDVVATAGIIVLIFIAIST